LVKPSNKYNRYIFFLFKIYAVTIGEKTNMIEVDPGRFEWLCRKAIGF